MALNYVVSPLIILIISLAVIIAMITFYLAFRPGIEGGLLTLIINFFTRPAV